MASEIDLKVKEWLKWDRNETTRTVIEGLVKDKCHNELREKLFKRLTFGTAGLRGKMDAGYNAMNDLVIIQTGQGLVDYLKRTDFQTVHRKGVVIGFDGRHNSERFAHLTKTIFLNADCPVNFFTRCVPTPFVSFAVRLYGCAAGIMITASHNPKEDNGYKVYGQNSAQIISPTDKHIQQSILDNLEPLDSSWEIVEKSPILQESDDFVMQWYSEKLANTILHGHKRINTEIGLKIVYTPMHGVGYAYINKLIEIVGLNMIPVEKQKDPDPDFPTVKYPNPEEGKSSLDLALELADEINSNLIIANDPDADRMATAERNPETGKWKIFTGNELGALLGWWLFSCARASFPEEPLENVYMLSSTVSSKILGTMAKSEGFQFIETLTGFKWMGNRTDELIKADKRVLFAFEEAIGFMCGTEVLDKDGISAAIQLATLASYLTKQGRTLSDKLDEIYDVYGHHVSLNSYFICHDGEKITNIFERLRNYGNIGCYPESICDKYHINYIRDLTTGYDNSQKDNKAILPVSRSSQMITFGFDNGLVCTLRTSGTEPKIKYYTEMCADPDMKDRGLVEKNLAEMVEEIVNEFLQPQQNELIPKSD